ncbi:endonuclease/exonuclease/phosphatase family protein [Salipiger mucosus]|uniref:Endonuclease/exonuclease/phosphatase domain-containing protein n=1 Tax=Salipiger mucosus DSM 16094 TaxID=1123237 RepID=S9QZ94_9RHOB|nr:endonuclease/exonuclease/phosphatase family protein [Salipiger mucosus]EPX84988.1 hypothetical protein Salmuc_00585 [Salipiger mucosus DSM 16094]
MRLVRPVLRTLALLLVGLLLVACAQQVRLTEWSDPPAPRDGALRIATLNVHYIDLRSSGDGPWTRAGWERRRPALTAAVGDMQADIIAFQEMESFRGGNDDSNNLARRHLLEAHPDYEAAATGDWRAFPSTQPIFYRSDRFELRDQGWFFFSDTPDVIYSRTFDGSWPAFASWAEFAPVGGGPAFRVVNLHFEYRSASNRRLSAELVAERIAPVIGQGTPVIVAGDLNALHGWRVMEILESAGLRFPRVPAATYHLNRGINLLGPIDHVGLTPDLQVSAGPFVLQRKYAGQWPSDHYPVLLDVTLP